MKQRFINFSVCFCACGLLKAECIGGVGARGDAESLPGEMFSFGDTLSPAAAH